MKHGARFCVVHECADKLNYAGKLNHMRSNASQLDITEQAGNARRTQLLPLSSPDRSKVIHFKKNTQISKKRLLSSSKRFASVCSTMVLMFLLYLQRLFLVLYKWDYVEYEI